MKTNNEIKAKIDKYMEMLYRTNDPDKTESYYHIIDALLWVIDDESGTPI